MADAVRAGALELFSPATREWFTGAFGAPTPAQEGAWRAAHSGSHSLVIAPTGSGKTLAAFLLALDRLATTPAPSDPRHRCRVLYVSPLKALAVDVQRNLRAPLAGITAAAVRLGAPRPDITVGMRTGDTPANERRAFQRTPTDVLVTTPESLFLLLTSNARESLRGITTVIVDEVHAVAGTKRGAHLALSLERLDALLPAPAQRIGLSATVRPVEEITSFLAGGRPVEVVSPKTPKTIELKVEVPVADLTELDGPKKSIWPSVEERVFELVNQHRSTIVFTNSRRVAERLTARLNELATGTTYLGPDTARAHELTHFPAEYPAQSAITTGFGGELVAKAHHGSMAHSARAVVESELKAGTLRCVVATSSLELGIDMGAVDLVVQVEAPPTVAAGLQRIGRAGHHVGAVSSGVLFPRFRGDLAPCAIVAERMSSGAIEAMRYPRNPLDVLAQQIVAMVAVEPWKLGELAEVIRRSAPFAELPDSALHAVLDMLAGRYPSTDFAELRPRITWDRATDELAARPGAQRLAVTSGGTIPDRGLYTVMTPASENGSGSRVGELDEEMVYESRVGDTILLGTSAWRITDITHDRVVVIPAPGEPARMPFWKGDTPGRPLELGRALGGFLREVASAEPAEARRRAARGGLDEWACDNLLAYLDEQRTVTGHVPDDETLLVERFRDELGDWRVVVHSPFGDRVNAPWALAIGARLRERRGLDAQVMHSDDGIVLRLPDSVDGDGRSLPLRAEDLLLEPEEVESALVAELVSSPLFSARFRECAARSLLLPRRDPRRRRPLWQQRQRSSQLLSVASAYPRFPVVLEAMRECLQDVYDVDGLRELMTDIRARRVKVAEVETTAASPFARTLLFGYVGAFMYDEDLPMAERRAAALSVDSALLAELLGTESVHELLDPEVIAEVTESLAYRTPERRARDAEDAADRLRLLGDLSEEEAEERGVQREWLDDLASAGRALRVEIAGQARYIAAEDAGRYQDALGVALPKGVPEAFLTHEGGALAELLGRFARTHGPFAAEEPARRYGMGVGVVADVLDVLTERGTLVRGELLDEGGTGYCDANVLRRIRRACVARLRAEVEPVEPVVLGRFLPSWHGIGTGARRGERLATVDDVLGCVEQLAGAPIPASALESLVLPARMPGYLPALLDELTIAGEVTWCGCGSLSGGDGWIALAPTDVADLLLPDAGPAPETALHQALLTALASGALFFRQLSDRVAARMEAPPLDSEVVSALWDLVWSGHVTSDSLAALRASVSGHGVTHRPRQGAGRGRYARLRASRPVMPTRMGPPTVSGRWALVPTRELDPTRRAHARTEAFLERHGVLTRGALDTERTTGGFSAIYKVLRGMEDTGQVVRGYVIDGLGAAQFAARGAVDQLRSMAATAPREGALVLAATDPAQPYGAALSWPEPVGETRHLPARKAGALVVLVDGRVVLYLERGGRSLLSFSEERPGLTAAASALAEQVHSGRIGPIAIRRADGDEVLASSLADVLRAAGFRTTPQGLRLRG